MSPDDFMRLTSKEIEKQYAIVSEYYNRFLKKFGVALPKLKKEDGTFTKDALVLIYLSFGYPNTRKVSKTELTKFIRMYYPDTNDVQQARHLGAQGGWWVVAGGRKGQHRFEGREGGIPAVFS